MEGWRGGTGQALLRAVRAIEARLLARRAGPPEPEAAIAEALARAWGGAAPRELAEAGRAIGAAVQAHGAAFAEGTEPAYHDRHHQAEATLCAGLLAEAARLAGLLGRRQAALLVLGMAGHDLLHDGGAGEAPGALERRSAAAALRLAAPLPEAERAEIGRLVLATAPGAAPADLPGRLAREADLFASLTPEFGWRLSRALARELRLARLPGAGEVATHGGRFALLDGVPEMTPAAIALGLDALRRLQLAALREAGGTASAGEGAERLDALPPEAAAERWAEALSRLGLPGLAGPPA